MPATSKEGQMSEGDVIRLALKEAKDLARSLEGTSTQHIMVKAGDIQIEIERGATAVAIQSVGGDGHAVQSAPATSGRPAGVVPIVAPLVGVFYRAGSPGGKPLVQVGDTVERGQKVGIIEAMKVMNDVLSDSRGVISEILVEDAAPVSYEQTLMLVDTSGGGSKT